MHKLLHRVPLFLLLIATASLVGCDSAGPTDDGGGEQNNAPVADAGVDQTVDVDTQVTLDGTGSSDEDNDGLNYSWSLAGPPASTATVTNPSSAVTSFTPDVAGEYTATLTVSDGTDDATDQVVITAVAASSIEISSDITEDRTLEAGPLYIVTRRVSVRDGAQLTIEPGVRIEFQADAGLFIDGNASSLVAAGTSADPIVMTGEQQQAGYWRGVGFESNNIQNEMTWVEIGYGGGSDWTFINEAANIALEAESRLTLTNSIVKNSDAYGLHGDKSVNLSGFADNTFENNAEAAVNIALPTAEGLDENSTFSGNTDAPYVRLYAQNVIDDMTLKSLAEGTPYQIHGRSTVRESSMLTINQGVRMEFGADAGLFIEGNGSSLVAVGTPSERIVMTAIQEQAGFWRGIGFESNNVQNEMTNVELAYGGGSSWTFINETAAVALDQSSRLKLAQSTVRNSAAYGLHGDRSVDLSGFRQNIFQDNEDAPVNIPMSAAGYIDGESGFDRNANAYVRVYDQNVTDDITITKLAKGVPYQVHGTPNVRESSSLTIDAGVQMEFAADAGIFIEGNGSSLVAVGTANDNIVMTGVQEQKGFWRGIGLESNNVINEMTYVDISYGGGSGWTFINEAANIGLDNGSRLLLTNSTISNSANYGLWMDREAELTTGSGNNTFTGNDAGGTGQN